MNPLVIMGIILTIFILSCIWIYHFTAAFQQTLTFKVPFDECYRYVGHHHHPIDSIKLTLTRPIRKRDSMIIPGEEVRRIMEHHIIQSYDQTLIVHESDTFIATETTLKRRPVARIPTLENLSILFFQQLAPLFPKYGCQLVSVRLASDEMTATNSRYKISNYTV